MNSTSPSERTFSGIIPPLVTPLDERDRLDAVGLERLVEHVIAGGVSGIFALGTTGEAPSLSYQLRREVIDRVCELVGQRVPVLVGVTDTSFVESIRLARHAADAGASAVVLATPYYFPAGQTELLSYLATITEQLPLPVMLYNFPAITKVWLEAKTLAKLTQIERIAGVKDSSGDLDYFKSLVQLRDQRPDWSLLMGPESLLVETIHLGGDGGVNGGANIYPQIFVDCYQATISQDEALRDRRMAEINALQDIYAIGKYASRYIKATKCALSVKGICNDFMAEPFHRFHAPERERVEKILARVEAEDGAVVE